MGLKYCVVLNIIYDATLFKEHAMIVFRYRALLGDSTLQIFNSNIILFLPSHVTICGQSGGGLKMIYFIEDDNSIRELVIYTLNGTGLEAVGFEKPSDFWRAMEGALPSLILLDIMLPEEDGLAILKKLRSSAPTKKLPVIMLTAKGSEYEKVLGLDLGADDYIPKPFGMIELIARVKALLRRTDVSDTPSDYVLGSLYVCPSRHIVKVDGQNVSLTLKEFEMLCLLLDNHDIVLTRDQILNRVWGYSFDGESRTVDVHVRTLRQKLGDAGDYIETIRGIGYKIARTRIDHQ